MRLVYTSQEEILWFAAIGMRVMMTKSSTLWSVITIKRGADGLCLLLIWHFDAFAHLLHICGILLHTLRAPSKPSSNYKSFFVHKNDVDTQHIKPNNANLHNVSKWEFRGKLKAEFSFGVCAILATTKCRVSSGRVYLVASWEWVGFACCPFY